MAEPYPIIEVLEGDRESEEMGSKRKFWYRHAETRRHWLFKYPRQNTGEHWAEKIAAEVARRLGFPHAKIELAHVGGKRGSASESFARGRRELVHGNQILDRVIRGYDPEMTYGQSRHTLAHIFRAIYSCFVAREAGQRAKRLIAGYMVLDALIGNTDRHHENWGILRKRVGNGWRGRVAPSFDHASSLGRELTDGRRDILLSESRVSKYADRGRGAVHWSENARRSPSPLKLVQLGSNHYPDLFRPALSRLARLRPSDLCHIVDRVPDNWMSESSRRFSVTFMQESLARLQELSP